MKEAIENVGGETVMAHNNPYLAALEEKWLRAGEARGLEIGEARGLATALVAQMRVKFGELSPEQEQRVRGASREDLDVWLVRLLTATTLEELLA